MRKYWDMNADEIASHYAIRRSQVDAALAYYVAHRQAIDADMEEQIEIHNRLANTADAKRSRAALFISTRISRQKSPSSCD